MSTTTIIQAPAVRPELMAYYCRGRTAYNQIFPWLYETVRDGVFARVRPTYPAIDALIGSMAPGMKRSLAKFPGRMVPAEWVAFSFGQLDLHDFHIGCVLDLDVWPATYILGLHIMDELLPEYRAGVETIDWERTTGSRPEFTYAAQVRESRWCDPLHPIDFGHLEAEVQRIVDRASRYYLAAAPLVYT